jgi:drug/metabolite transporter (DMT)-like permease
MCSMLHIRVTVRAMHPTPRCRPRLTRQGLALLGITAIWGAGFLVVHLAVQHSGPWFFVGLRFLTAALLGAGIFRRSLRSVSGLDLLAGVSIGVTLYLGYGFQTVGLQIITPSASAFITALYVPLVPLLQWLILRKRPGVTTLAGVVVAFVGLVLLGNPFAAAVGFGQGEATTLIGTLAIAAEILLIGLFAGRVNLGAVTVFQLAVAGLLALATVPAVGERLPLMPHSTACRAL